MVSTYGGLLWVAMSTFVHSRLKLCPLFWAGLTIAATCYMLIYKGKASSWLSLMLELEFTGVLVAERDLGYKPLLRRFPWVGPSFQHGPLGTQSSAQAVVEPGLSQSKMRHRRLEKGIKDLE